MQQRILNPRIGGGDRIGIKTSSAMLKKKTIGDQIQHAWNNNPRLSINQSIPATLIQFVISASEDEIETEKGRGEAKKCTVFGFSNRREMWVVVSGSEMKVI